jgi:hypothetical protein
MAEHRGVIWLPSQTDELILQSSKPDNRTDEILVFC